ncbi:MAG: putative drug exporter of the superfamily [Chloroflexota bacterium]|jgi:RND superfamily putative drug exporter|nr:putative drug exporter of the superfamily [Chloroflexota bacterium]
MFDLLARLVTRRAWFVVGGAVAFTALSGALGGSVSAKLHQGGFVRPNSESEAAIATLAEATGTRADRNVIALVRVDSMDSPVSRGEVEQVARTIGEDPDVKTAWSFYQTNDPSMVAKDGHQTLVYGLFDKNVDDDRIAAAATRLQTKFKSDSAVTLGGVGTTFAEVQSNVQDDLARAETIAFPILFILMLWVFRGAVAALLPLMVGGITVLGTFLGLQLFNGMTPLSIFALNLATGLGLGLSIDYSLFMVSRFREELGAGRQVAEAVDATVRTAGRTIFFSSLTVAAALASMTLFPLNFLFSMGVAGVIVVVIAATTALVVLPAVLRLLGTKVNALAPRRWQRSEATSKGFWYSLSRFVMRRSVVVALVSGGLLVVIGMPFLGIRFNSVDATTLPSTASARVVDSAIKRDFPGQIGAPAIVVVRAGQDRAAEVSAFADRVATVKGVDAVAKPQFQGAGVWSFNASLGNDPYVERSTRALQDIRALSASFPVQSSGLTAQFVDLQRGLVDSLPLAVAMVTLTTLVILFLMTGSVVLPVKAILMNMLTLSATFGVLVAIFQWGNLEGVLAYTSSGALEQTQPVLLFALIFGLSTDYGVFLLARIKEARDGGRANTEAVALGIQRTGRIVSAAALLFCVAIGAFATSNIVFMKELGVGTVTGVLIDATVVRALLVPSLMGVLGEWNWWAPGFLRRLHRRLGITEGGPAPAAAGS